MSKDSGDISDSEFIYNFAHDRMLHLAVSDSDKVYTEVECSIIDRLYKIAARLERL